MERAVGVIGGLGPAATTYFMERVIDFTKAACDQEHINMIVFNHATTPDRTAWITGADDRDPLPIMINDAKTLSSLGVTFIVIPCNTAHYFYEDIQRVVDIPVVNIVKETVYYAAAQVDNMHTIGVMATDGTIFTKSYQLAAEKMGLSWVVPDERMQKATMDMIYGGIKCGRTVSRAEFDEVANHLRARGADSIILGCTELSVLKRDLQIRDEDVIDSIDVLAVETVRRMGKPMTEAARHFKGVGL